MVRVTDGARSGSLFREGRLIARPVTRIGALSEGRSVPLFWKGNGTISLGCSGETFPTTRRSADFAGPLE